MIIVDIAVRAEDDVDVFVFRKTNAALVAQVKYCVVGMHGIAAYLYISALHNMLGAQLDARALPSYRYIKSLFDLEGRKN